jgi:hypothetical protein
VPPAAKTAEQKKISRVANRTSSAARERRLSGPVIVTAYKKQEQ